MRLRSIAAQARSATSRAVGWQAWVAAALVGTPLLPAQGDLAQSVGRLASADASQRSAAYQELQRRRDPAALPLLVQQMAAMPLAGQQLAFYLLQQHPIDLTRPHYSKLLAAEGVFPRAAAAAALLRQPDQRGNRELVAKLAAAIQAAQTNEIAMVANTLHGLQQAELAEPLRSHLRASLPTPTLVQLLQRLQEIEQSRSAATAKALQALRNDSDPQRKAAVLAWLLGTADATVATELAALLQTDPQLFWQVDQLFDRDQKLPAALAEAIGLALAKPRHKFVIGPTAALLHRSAPDLALRTLRQLLDHGSGEERAGALAALATLPGGLDGPRLKLLLASEVDEVRLTAADLLRRRDDYTGLPQALAVAEKPGPMRSEAARVLGGFRKVQVIAPLLDLLDVEEVQVRRNAWQSLQQVWRDLFPYRRFDFAACGYTPDAADRGEAIQRLRTWWAALRH